MPKISGFCTIICIDVENFSSTRRKHSDQVSIRENLYRIAKEALRELNEPLDRYHFDDRGDGMLIVTPTGLDNEWLAKKFLRTLDQLVRRHNESKSRPECRFRLRVAINIGNVKFDENGVIGNAVITAVRMLDSRRLKNELAKSKKIALAACISPCFYEQAVAHIPIEAEFRKRSFRAKNAGGFIWVWTGNGCGRLRPTRRGIGAVVLMLAATGIWLILPRSTPTAPQSLLGPDPRMADPCALIDRNALAQFGRVELDSDSGEFSRCDIIVRSGESKIDVKVQFQNPGTNYTRYAVTVERIGLVVFEKSCQRILILPDGYLVEVDPTRESGTTDPCVISDVVTQHAIKMLNEGSVPPRAYEAMDSLFYSNACEILSNDQLSRFPGIDADEPDVNFGNWSCSWESTTHGISLKVMFDQSPKLNADNSRPVEIHSSSAFVKPERYGGACVVQMPSPWRQSSASPANAEVLLIVVEGGWSIEELCELAVRVAS